MNGGLRQRFALGMLQGSPEFSFPIYLQHGFREGEPVSEYKIPQLESYVAPEGREEILWLEPGGTRHFFKTKDILSKAPDKQTEPWVALKVDGGNYEFRSDDGWTYRYDSGSIVSLSAPTGRKLHFQTEGLRIRRIYQTASGKEVNLLECKDNDLGQPESLQIGLEKHAFKFDPKSEHLLSWHTPDMGEKSVTFSYSAKGLLESITPPTGDKATYTWGGNDGAWQKDAGLELPKQENGAFLIADSDYKYTYGMNKAGLNLMRTDVLGIREGFIYNPKTQQFVRRNRDGGETTEFFGAKGTAKNRLESARDARGRETVRLTYDDQGRVKTKQMPGQPPLRFEYDEHDRITKIFRMEDLIKSYEYPAGLQPTKITDALGHSVEIAYNQAGQVTRYKNLDGAVYEFIYDDLGQLTEQRLPMGYKKSTEYDTFGRVTKVTAPDGRQTSYSYTDKGQLSSVKGNDAVWEYQYNPEGELTSLLRDGATWQKTEREKLADTGEEIVRQTNAKGDETVLQLDKNGRMVKSTDALGQETKFKHDALGQLTGWEDERGAKADLERDAEGRVAGVNTGESAPLQMAYDLTGRIRKRSNGAQDIAFKYDKEGRMTQIDYNNGQTVDYTYDNYSRILTATTGQGVKTTYTWDALDRKSSERTDLPTGDFTLTQWTYTPSNRTKSLSVYKNGTDPKHRLQETTYAYDPLGRYTSISINGVEKIWYDYDPKSMALTQKRFHNGWTIHYTYDSTGHPQSLTTKDKNGKTLKDVRYVWNKEGKLTQRILDGTPQDYTYDPLGRLTHVNKSQK